MPDHTASRIPSYQAPSDAGTAGYSPAQAAAHLGVTPDELVRLDANARLRAHQSPTDALVYSSNDIADLRAYMQGRDAESNPQSTLQENAMQSICEAPEVIDAPTLCRVQVEEKSHNESVNAGKRRTSRRNIIKFPAPDLDLPGSVEVHFRTTTDLQVTRRIAEGVALLRELGREAIAARSSNPTITALAG